jgi:hypothetical protein
MTDANDELKGSVQEKLASVRANFERLYGEMPAETLELVRRRAVPEDFEGYEAPSDCPACRSPGVATGTQDFEWDYDRLLPGSRHPSGTMWFDADGFICRVCGLELTSPVELRSAGMEERWEVEFNPLDCVFEIDENVAYEIWRNKQRRRIS